MLDTPRAPTAATPGEIVSRHGPLARIAMMVLGAVISLVFGALATFPVFVWRKIRGLGPILGSVVGFLFLLALAAYGVLLVWRGLRGHTTYSRRFARVNNWPMQPANRRRLLIVVLVGYLALLAGIAVHLGPNPFVKLQRGLGDGGDSLLWWVALGLFALPIHVAVHELGHAAAGALAGFRIVSLRLGPLLFVRERERWRAERKPVRIPVGVDGFVSAIPGGDGFLQPRLLFFFAGGILANLALGLLCIRVLRVAPSPITDGGAIAQGALTGCAWTGVFMTFANLLPYRVGLFPTDGLQMLRSLSGTETATVLRHVWVQSLRGRRPLTWGWTSDGLLELAKRNARHADELSYLAFLVALDKKQADVAENIQGQFIERWKVLDTTIRELIAYQTALALALTGELGGARNILRAVDDATRATGVLGLLEATIALAEGDAGRAQTQLARWEDATTRSGLPAARVGLEWAVEALGARLEGAPPRPGAGHSVIT